MDIIALGAMAVVVNRFVEGFIKPLFEKFSLDKFWLMYIAWVLAGALVYLTGANVFAEAMPNYPLVGQIFTALFAGGGSNILADWVNRKNPAGITNYSMTTNGAAGPTRTVAFSDSFISKVYRDTQPADEPNFDRKPNE